MGFANKAAHDAYIKRKADRYSIQGREQEDQVWRILSRARLEGEPTFAWVTHHAAYSTPDRQGKDFTVARVVRGEIVSRSFGVTISLKSWKLDQQLYPGVPQFCFPIGTRPDTIIKRILSLFDDSGADEKTPAG